MAGPNDKHRQGGHKPPPSVIASAAAAAPEVEPVRPAPVAAASPAPVIAEPAPADVEPPSAKPEASGGIDMAPIADAAAKFVHTLAAANIEAGDIVLPTKAALGEQRTTFVFVEDAPPTSYVAVCPIFVGGQRGRVEPGEEYKPASDAERDMLLAQRVIRAS